MKKYFCDVCGAEIAQGGNAPPSPTAELCELEDLCPRCDGFARELDASALVLRELRRMAAKQEAHRLPLHQILRPLPQGGKRPGKSGRSWRRWRPTAGSMGLVRFPSWAGWQRWLRVSFET